MGLIPFQWSSDANRTRRLGLGGGAETRTGTSWYPEKGRMF